MDSTDKVKNEMKNEIESEVEIAAETTMAEVQERFLNTEFDEITIRKFLGDSADYYIKKWTKSQNPEKRPSFSWAGLLFPLEWFGYRKMYRNFIIYLLVLYTIIAASLVVYYFSAYNESLFRLSLVLGLLLFRVYLSMYANSLYYKHTMSKLKKLQKLSLEKESYENRVKQSGGISIWGLLLGLAIPYLTRLIEQFFVIK